MFADGFHKLQVCAEKAIFVGLLRAVNISERETHNIGSVVDQCFSQGCLVNRIIHVQNADIMSFPDGARHVIKSQRVHRVGAFYRIRGYKQYLHKKPLFKIPIPVTYGPNPTIRIPLPPRSERPLSQRCSGIPPDSVKAMAKTVATAEAEANCPVIFL